MFIRWTNIRVYSLVFSREYVQVFVVGQVQMKDFFVDGMVVLFLFQHEVVIDLHAPSVVQGVDRLVLVDGLVGHMHVVAVVHLKVDKVGQVHVVFLHLKVVMVQVQ